MKKRVICTLTSAVLVLLISIPCLHAQKIEVIPFFGYQTSAKIPSVNGDFRVNDGMNYGVSLDLGSGDAGYKVFITYSRQGSLLELEDTTGISRTVCDLAVHYISIGGQLEFFQGDMIVPFTKLGLGTTLYQPLGSDITLERVMHFNIGGGAKIFFNDHFGVRFQTSLLLPVFFEGYYFEEGAPEPGEGMKTKLTGIQGDFTAGLIARF